VKKYQLISISSVFSVILLASILVPVFLTNITIGFRKEDPACTNAINTIMSLKRIHSSYPFYVMKYYGDYGFLDVIDNGVTSIGEFPDNMQFACTCFSALNPCSDPIYGRNFDWMEDGGLFLLTEPSYGYASICTINLAIMGLDSAIDPNDPETQERLLLSPYYLMDGMNEYGLIIGIMAISRASRVYNASQPTISSLDIVRLGLEFAKTIDETLILWQNYNIDFGPIPIHYLLADSSGDSAIVEWIDGQMHIYPNEEYWQVSTNFIFTDETPPYPCWRYNTAYQLLQGASGSVTMEEGMAILESCSLSGYSSTLWSNIYNLETREVHIAINRNYDRIYEFHF